VQIASLFTYEILTPVQSEQRLDQRSHLCQLTSAQRSQGPTLQLLLLLSLAPLDPVEAALC
jgi:hypothetical protein